MDCVEYDYLRASAVLFRAAFQRCSSNLNFKAGHTIYHPRRRALEQAHIKDIVAFAAVGQSVR